MEIRNPRFNEVEDIVSLVSSAFGYQAGEGDVARDFPQLYNVSNYGNLWAAFEGGKLAAHAGFYPATMKVESVPLPVAGIGGVFTEEAQRGQGLAAQLLEKCTEKAKAKGAALAFLWSDKHDYYARLGFHLVGRQWTIALAPAGIPALREAGEKLGLSATQIKVVEGEITTDFLFQSLRLQEKLNVGIKRTSAEHHLLLASGACRIFSAWMGKDLVAYFVIGKGKDLGHYVHEWAGEEVALHHLAATCLELSGGATLMVLSPQFMPDEVKWIYTLDEMGFSLRAEQMGLVKLLDFPKLQALVAEYLTRIGLSPADLELAPGAGGYSVRWKKGAPMTFEEPAFMKLLFGPEMPAHPELKGFLPLRLWYWGMDSV